MHYIVLSVRSRSTAEYPYLHNSWYRNWRTAHTPPGDLVSTNRAAWGENRRRSSEEARPLEPRRQSSPPG